MSPLLCICSVCVRALARARVLSFYMWAHALLRRALAKLGARDVIVKPFDPMLLAEQIRSIWLTGRY